MSNTKTADNAKTEDMPHVVVPQGAPMPQKAKHGKEGEYTPPLSEEEQRKKILEANKIAAGVASGKEQPKEQPKEQK